MGDLGGEGGEGEVAELGEAGVDGGKVGGVVDGVAVGETRKFVGAVRGGEGHRGGVGLDEKAVERERAKDVAFGGLAVAEKVAVEGKVGAERSEIAGEFGGAAVGVKEEPAGRKRSGTKDVGEGAPGVEAVDRDGEIALGGEVELPGEGVALLVERRPAETGEAGIVGAGAIEDPAVETDFADEGVRVGVEGADKGVAPVRGGVADVPGVEAVAGEEGELRGGR